MRRAALVLAVTLAAARAHAFDASMLEFERSVENVTAPGLYHVEIDPELYRHAHKDGLGDVRIVAPDGKEVPYLVRRVPPPQQAEPRAVRFAAADTLPDGAVRALFDLGPGGARHTELTLVVDSAGDWTRQARLEASRDGTRFAALVAATWLFRVTVAGRVAVATTLGYPASDARWLRVTLLPPADVVVRVVGASAAYVPPEAHPFTRLLPPQKPQPIPEPGDVRTSQWTIDLGAPGVPIADVALGIDEDAFTRRALLSAGADRRDLVPIAATLLYRVAPAQAGKLAEENVRIGGGGTRRRWLGLTLYDGGAKPLRLRDVSPAYAAEELVFRAPAAGAYALYVGGDLPAPSYPLAAELARSHEEPRLAAALGTIAPNPTFAHLAKPPPPPKPTHRRPPLPLLIVLGLAAIAGAAWLLHRKRRARHRDAG